MAHLHWMRRETITLDPIRIGSRFVSPQVRVSCLRLPGGGFVRCTPAAVLVRSERGHERIPIRDLTRVLRPGVTVMLFAIALLGAIAIHRSEEVTP